MFYGDYVIISIICEDFFPNFGVKRTGCCIMTMHHLTLSFSQGISEQKHDYCPPPTLDTVEVIEAELQVVLKTLTEHDFQDVFKEWEKHWKQCICVEAMVPVHPKLVFDPTGSTSPRNYGYEWSLVQPSGVRIAEARGYRPYYLGWIASMVRLFPSTMSRLALGPSELPVQWVLG
jgi:hypothetical protein